MKVDGISYCFDERGIMQMGWVKRRSAAPGIKGYRYYADKTDKTGVMGERTDSAWRRITGPGDADRSGDVE